MASREWHGVVEWMPCCTKERPWARPEDFSAWKGFGTRRENLLSPRMVASVRHASYPLMVSFFLFWCGTEGGRHAWTIQLISGSGVNFFAFLVVWIFYNLLVDLNLHMLSNEMIIIPTTRNKLYCPCLERGQNRRLRGILDLGRRDIQCKQAASDPLGISRSEMAGPAIQLFHIASIAPSAVA